MTAFVAAKGTSGVQFTLNSGYCALSEKQVKDLIDVLQKRLNHEDGFCATDGGEALIINPDGEAVEE